MYSEYLAHPLISDIKEISNAVVNISIPNLSNEAIAALASQLTATQRYTLGEVGLSEIIYIELAKNKLEQLEIELRFRLSLLKSIPEVEQETLIIQEEE